MKFAAVCITTDNAPRLAKFYEIILQEQPLVEGSHYGFNNSHLAVYDPGDVTIGIEKNVTVMFYTEDLLSEYERLLRELPELEVTSLPQHRPWGAYSFWFHDPDGNTVSCFEKQSVGS
jgi:hypothetical protein